MSEQLTDSQSFRFETSNPFTERRRFGEAQGLETSAATLSAVGPQTASCWGPPGAGIVTITLSAIAERLPYARTSFHPHPSPGEGQACALWHTRQMRLGECGDLGRERQGRIQTQVWLWVRGSCTLCSPGAGTVALWADWEPGCLVLAPAVRAQLPKGPAASSWWEASLGRLGR